MTADGPVVVYRDRSEQEIRDISIVRLHDGKWSQPSSVFEDNWKINGCPVNGLSFAKTQFICVFNNFACLFPNQKFRDQNLILA